MRRILWFLLLMTACSNPSQQHQHDHVQMTANDGQFNPTVIADGHNGFYLAYVERKTGKSDVFLRHSDDGKDFSAPVRVPAKTKK